MALALKREIAGLSVEGRPIERLVFTKAGIESKKWLLLMGAHHGDEPQGPWLLNELTRLWENGYPLGHYGTVILPVVNPDGFAANTRTNANAVDLNRNLPTRDWTDLFEDEGNNPGTSPASEPETEALIETLAHYPPTAILTVHSMKRYQINCNGPARAWSEALSSLCGYPVTEDIGYPCPGSFGTYAGAEKRIPTITFEVERGLDKQKVIDRFLPVVRAALDWWDSQ